MISMSTRREKRPPQPARLFSLSSVAKKNGRRKRRRDVSPDWKIGCTPFDLPLTPRAPRALDSLCLPRSSLVLTSESFRTTVSRASGYLPRSSLSAARSLSRAETRWRRSREDRVYDSEARLEPSISTANPPRDPRDDGASRPRDDLLLLLSSSLPHHRWKRERTFFAGGACYISSSLEEEDDTREGPRYTPRCVTTFDIGFLFFFLPIFPERIFTLDRHSSSERALFCCAPKDERERERERRFC